MSSYEKKNDILSLALIFVSAIYIPINNHEHDNYIYCYCHQSVHSNIGYQNHCKIDLLVELYVFMMYVFHLLVN